MGLFRRREPLHEKLAREGGLTAPDLDPRPRWQEAGVHGLPRPREWDATVTADAPELGGEQAQFVVLPDGTVLVEDAATDDSLEPLATAVEATLQPPYRARARRQSGTLWAVQARRIRVVEIPNGPAGETIELITTPEGKTLTVDDAREFGSVPELEGLGDVVRATRLDGNLWELQVERL